MAKQDADWTIPTPSMRYRTPEEMTLTRIISFPSRYMIGRGCLADIGKHISFMEPKKALIVGGKSALAATENIILSSLKKHNVDAVNGDFSGNCTVNEIKRLTEFGRGRGVDIVIGVGGGRALDAAKGAAFGLKLPVVIAATVTATDAPASANSVVYNDKGEFEAYYVYPKNPDLVLIDSEVIANSPVRYLVSGMGGAISLCMEAETSWKAWVKNYAGGLPPWSTGAIGKATFANLMQYGKAAKLAVERKVVTPAVEIIIEAITLLGSTTFETGNMSVAHSIYHGWRGAVPPKGANQKFLTGEVASFGTLVHQVIENHPIEEMYQIIDFNRSVGLPTCLADIDMDWQDKDTLSRLAQAACTTGTAHNAWFHVEPKLIFDAIIAADGISREYQGR